VPRRGRQRRLTRAGLSSGVERPGPRGPGRFVW
jgi:hypothetical protein